MDEIEVVKPDTIKYTDYMYFSPEEATAWVYDIVKYAVDVKHKNFISLNEYSGIVKRYKEYLENNGVKLLSNHMLLDDKDVRFYEFIQKIWGIEPDLVDMNGDTAYNISQQLVAHKPKAFYYDFFNLLKDKQSVTIELEKYTLSKLLPFDYKEIERIYEGEYIFPNGDEPKFYLVMDKHGDVLDYVHKFVREKVLNPEDHAIVWDVFENGTNECVALVYLNVVKEEEYANLDIILNNDISDTGFSEVIKLIKKICFDKIGLKKVCAVNYNMSFAYSALNSIYHFAGFKATYDVDHSTFEAEPDTIPTLDELYNNNESVIDNIVVDI